MIASTNMKIACLLHHSRRYIANYIIKVDHLITMTWKLLTYRMDPLIFSHASPPKYSQWVENESPPSHVVPIGPIPMLGDGYKAPNTNK